MQSSTETAMTAVRILAACLALALAGCVETRFESPIGDNIETCDAGWKGLWIDADAPNRDRPEKADAAFYVNDACEFIVLDAAVCVGYVSPYWGFAVLSLLLPTMILTLLINAT